MNVLITTARDGVLTVHKDTCKKIEGRETQGVENLLDLNPGALTTAKKASCCKPSDAILDEVEQAGWDALEAIANAPESEGLSLDPIVSRDDEGNLVTDDGDVELIVGEPVDEDEDLIGDLIGAPTPEPAKGKTVTKVTKAKTEARELNGLEALGKVADHLGIEVSKKPVFPGFGKAFKTADKQSVYINSKGNADVRATDAAQADAWSILDHVERRSGNYVRVNLAAL